MAKFGTYDFLDIIEKYNIPYEERDNGKLFTLSGAKSILESLLEDGKSENHIFKTYYVELENSVSVDEQQQYVVQFGNGIFLEGEKKAESFVTLPATLEWISDKSCNITICEGKFHQVRRMFFAMKNEVTFLKRIAIGKLFLDSCVQLGNCVKLTKEDIMNLL